MASPDVILRYGDEEEFIPAMEYVPVNSNAGSNAGTPVDEKADALSNASPTVMTPGGGPGTKKAPTKKILQGRKMKGGRVVKGGIPPQDRHGEKGGAERVEDQRRWRGSVETPIEW